MTPYDGSGYGQSTYWTWQLRSIAAQNGEACGCWEASAPRLKIKPDDKVRIKIKCVAKGLMCKQGFPETEKEMKIRFERFYKV